LKKINKINGGMEMSTTSANSRFQEVLYMLVKWYRDNCTVIFFAPGRKYRGLTKSLKYVTAERTTTVDVTDFRSGRRTWIYSLSGPHPSIIAASSISRGIVAMNPLYRIVAKGNCKAASTNTRP